jgi:hypothetical protein
MYYDARDAIKAREKLWMRFTHKDKAGPLDDLCFSDVEARALWDSILKDTIQRHECREQLDVANSFTAGAEQDRDAAEKRARDLQEQLDLADITIERLKAALSNSERQGSLARHEVMQLSVQAEGALKRVYPELR